MIRAGLSSFSLHLPDALGDPWFELDDGGKSVSGSFRQTPTLDLLDFPAEVAAHGINCVDLCIPHIPNIDSGATWPNYVPLSNQRMWSCISC